MRIGTPFFETGFSIMFFPKTPSRIELQRLNRIDRPLNLCPPHRCRRCMAEGYVSHFDSRDLLSEAAKRIGTAELGPVCNLLGQQQSMVAITVFPSPSEFPLKEADQLALWVFNVSIRSPVIFQLVVEFVRVLEFQ